MFQVEVFYVVVRYQRFRGPCCFQLQGEDGGSTDLWNIGIFPQHYTTSQLKRSRIEVLDCLKN